MNSAAADRSSFAALGLDPALVRAVTAEGYVSPTPIQAQSIPSVLAGRDMLGCAQTGTGKTAAFVLPILQRLSARPRNGKVRALVIAPTRELAAQIDERVDVYGRHLGLRHVVIYGGVGQRPQEDALRRNPDILVATPGRLLDLMNQGFIRLDGIEVLVLDEADRMLDMGFIHDVRKIVAAVPQKRQTLLFSATVPSEIAKLVASVLVDPVKVAITPEKTTAETVEQCVHFVAKNDKRALLERVLKDEGATRTIVFTRTKHGANRLAEQLTRGGIDALPIHGNKSQGARERALLGFRDGTIPVLVATDVAARGIDVDGVSHVVNYDLPNVAESYVHRIGRTGRAGARGRAIAFCDPEERPLLRDIERFIKRAIPVAAPIVLPPSPPAPTNDRPPRPQGGREHRGDGERRSAPHAQSPARSGQGAQARNGQGRHAQTRNGQSNQPRNAQGPRGPAVSVARPQQASERNERPSDAGAPATDGAGHASNGEAQRSRRSRRRYRGARLY